MIIPITKNIHFGATLAGRTTNEKFEQWELQRELDEAREQRDALLKSLDVAQQVGIQLGEQRDRLAGALRIIAEGTSCRECGGEDEALRASEALQSLFCDALQSLTPNSKEQTPT